MLIFHLLTVIPYAYLQFYREAGVGSHLLAFPIALLARLSRVAALGLAIGGSIELQFTYLTLAAYAFTAFWRAIIPESPDGLFSYIRPDPFRIEAWPKPSIRPWMADSVTELWGKRWHPLFRRPLVAVGGRPLIKLAHTLGFKSQVATSICAATGAFFLSGFIHEHSEWNLICNSIVSTTEYAMS